MKNGISVLRYAIIKYEVKKYTVEFECIKCETIHKILAGPMGIIPKVRNTIKKQKKCTKVSRKQFGTNEIGLLVKRKLDVLYVQHLVD